MQPGDGVDERLRRSRSCSPRGWGEGEGKGKSKGTGCFNCGASDHRARDCPAKQNRQPRPEPRWRREGRTPRTALVRQIYFQLRHGIGKDKGETASIHELENMSVHLLDDGDPKSFVRQLKREDVEGLFEWNLEAELVRLRQHPERGGAASASGATQDAAPKARASSSGAEAAPEEWYCSSGIAETCEVVWCERTAAPGARYWKPKGKEHMWVCGPCQQLKEARQADVYWVF